MCEWILAYFWEGHSLGTLFSIRSPNHTLDVWTSIRFPIIWLVFLCIIVAHFPWLGTFNLVWWSILPVTYFKRNSKHHYCCILWVLLLVTTCFWSLGAVRFLKLHPEFKYYIISYYMFYPLIFLVLYWFSNPLFGVNIILIRLICSL